LAIGIPIGDSRGSELKARAEQWLREFRRKGEGRMLTDGVVAADRNSPESACIPRGR
jgi:hypothetical protein